MDDAEAARADEWPAARRRSRGRFGGRQVALDQLANSPSFSTGWTGWPRSTIRFRS